MRAKAVFDPLRTLKMATCAFAQRPLMLFHDRGQGVTIWLAAIVEADLASEPLVYVSYSRVDREIVAPIVEELQKLGVKIWIDSIGLSAGESWEHQIFDALSKATILLTFISRNSRRSEWVNRELAHVAARGARILPVRIDDISGSELPFKLHGIQWLDATKLGSAQAVAAEIAEFVARTSPVIPGSSLRGVLRDAAKALAAQSKGTSGQLDVPPAAEVPPTSVFIVHGHDEDMLKSVVEFVESLGVKAIVLRDIGGATRSLMDKFFEIGGAAKFAIALLSGDDFGASRRQFEEPGVGDRALKYRSRQNVVLELGFFYGLLGWESVFVLENAPPRVFPDFERPSDLNGVVFDRYDESGKWKLFVAKRLRDHGFILKA